MQRGRQVERRSERSRLAQHWELAAAAPVAAPEHHGLRTPFRAVPGTVRAVRLATRRAVFSHARSAAVLIAPAPFLMHLDGTVECVRYPGEECTAPAGLHARAYLRVLWE
jgi:hypothetical protein